MINPRPLHPERASYWRVLAMARATGTDLPAAFARGDVGSQEWADTIARCRGCGWGAGCENWIAGGDGAAQVPQACPNAALFQRLDQV